MQVLRSAGVRPGARILRGARNLVSRSDVQTFTRADGDKLYYDAARNEFAVLKPGGILRTYFKPRNGSHYWTTQTGG
jgi:pyocin large subunit-like protein